MKTSIQTLAVITTLGLWGLQQASAQVTAVGIGTADPPAMLGPYTMTPFDPGSIAGQSYYSHLTDGNWDGGGTGEWNTWGQNYTGNVYAAVNQTVLTLNLTGDVEAVDFYEEPYTYAYFDMTATDSSGATVTQIINGYYGSAGVGFYEDAAGGPYLTQITITSTDPTGFAIGEFGISGGSLSGSVGPPTPTVPDAGSTLLLMAMGICGVLGLTRPGRAAKV